MLNKKMNLFEQLFYAVIKPKKYYRLTKVSGGHLTGFVFLFLLIISLFNIVPMFYNIVGPNGFYQAMQDDLPSFELSKGELFVAERYEYNNGDQYILIDTTIDRFDYEQVNKDYSQVMLVSRTNMINYRSYGRMQGVDFKDLGGFHFNNAILTSLLPFLYLILILTTVCVYLFLVGTYYLSALLYSLLGLFVSSVSHANLTYATIFKTAIYSKVTIRILYSLIDLTSLSIPGYVRSIIAILVTSVYVVFGILSHTSDDAYEEAGIPIPPKNYS